MSEMLKMLIVMTIALAEKNHGLRNSMLDSEELAKYIKGDSITIKIFSYGMSYVKVQYVCEGADKPYELPYLVQAPNSNLSAEEYAACRISNAFFAHEKALSILKLATGANSIEFSVEDIYAEKTKEILSRAKTSENFKDVNEQELEMLIKLI